MKQQRLRREGKVEVSLSLVPPTYRVSSSPFLIPKSPIHYRSNEWLSEWTRARTVKKWGRHLLLMSLLTEKNSLKTFGGGSQVWIHLLRKPYIWRSANIVHIRSIPRPETRQSADRYCWCWVRWLAGSFIGRKISVQMQQHPDFASPMNEYTYM